MSQQRDTSGQIGDFEAVAPPPKDRRFSHPGAFVVGWFGILIAVGTALLSLPISHRNAPVSVTDCLFTAASAVTVTGLSVVDTGTSWSPFGEIVLISLIQIGGLGVMTLAGFTGLLLNRRLRVRSGMLAGAEIGLDELGVLRTLIRDLMRFVVLAEGIFSILLTIKFFFEGEHEWWRAIHLGVFHAVSAFNNAGFSVLPTGLEPYTSDWFVSLVIAAAFILGGIGFPVVFEIARHPHRPKRWTLHTKVTLSMSAMLLAAGTAMVAMGEWTNPDTMGSLGVADKVLASFFQSATTRTAGFATVPVGAMRESTLLAMLPLMVIGASSASTGGGIKTSTFALMVKSTISEFQRDSRVTIFERHPPLELQRQALALVIAALATVGTATFILTLAHETIPTAELLFEAASAFGTVGLSTGVTGELNWFTRLLIMVLMFIGRVGPITFGTAFLLRPSAKLYEYPDESMLVG